MVATDSYGMIAIICVGVGFMIFLALFILQKIEHSFELYQIQRREQFIIEQVIPRIQNELIRTMSMGMDMMPAKLNDIRQSIERGDM